MEKKSQEQKMEGIEEEREFDVIIFAASGFTGKYAVREALKFLNPSSPMKSLALAGRDKSKVSQALKWASGPAKPPPIPILYADSSDRASLLSVCRRAKVVLSCVSPFCLYGEPVVAACVECRTHYLDISSEPAFIEKTEDVYHEKAEKAGSLIISGCAHNSIIAELGLMFHTQQWVSPAVVNRVEAYLHVESDKRKVLNSGTVESAALGVGRHFQELKPRRRVTLMIPGPPAPSIISTEYQKSIGLWAVWLPSNDPIAVRRTLSLLTENPKGIPGVNETEEDIEKREKFWESVKPAHFGAKLCSESFLGMIRWILIGILVGLFGLFSFGRWLLSKYPEISTLGLFRKTGPTEEEVKSATFKKWLIGRGYSDYRLAGNKKPDMEIITRISGPEIGYVGTSIVLIQCVLVLLGQRRKFPKGGVFPPGILFGPTDLQERLQQNGISYDVVAINGRPA